MTDINDLAKCSMCCASLCMMKYSKYYNEIQLNNTIVLIGKFDGLHAGHRELIKIAEEMRNEDMEVVLLSFFRDKSGTSDCIPERRLSNFDEMMVLGEELGIDYFLEFPFSDNVRNMSPEEFIRKILKNRLGASIVITGTDFRFGKNRAGDVRTLARVGRDYGIKTIVVPKKKYKGTEISSTFIKDRLADGDLEAVNAMLGRPYSVLGSVVHGDKDGHRIGFPTINFEPEEDKLLPPNGVYATKTLFGDAEYISMTNIGSKPTFGEGRKKRVETHIFDFDKDIYGEKAEVRFYKFLRAEITFESEEALINMLKQNLEQTAGYFRDNPV